MGRTRSAERWEELCSLLNADPSGDPKMVDKWKKVWSDFKLNTKKKAARLNRAIHGTGGGPASTVKLSVLEERVLHIIGSQAATGLIDVVEAGLPPREEAPNTTSPLAADSIGIIMEDHLWDVAGPSQEQYNFSANLAGPSNAGAASPINAASPVNAPSVDEAAGGIDAPIRLTSNDGPARPSSAGSARPAAATGSARLPRRLQTTPHRHARGPRHRSPRRRSVNTDPAQDFLRSDAAYRAFERERWERQCQLEAERNLIMRNQNETMLGWQRIADRALDILEKYIKQ